jgi:hypothetical protein
VNIHGSYFEPSPKAYFLWGGTWCPRCGTKIYFNMIPASGLEGDGYCGCLYGNKDQLHHGRTAVRPSQIQTDEVGTEVAPCITGAGSNEHQN